MPVALCEAPVTLPDGRPIMVTISVGACIAEAGETLETTTDMADAALYIAKEQGRNKVVIFDAEMPSTGKPRLGIG